MAIVVLIMAGISIGVLYTSKNNSSEYHGGSMLTDSLMKTALEQVNKKLGTRITMDTLQLMIEKYKETTGGKFGMKNIKDFVNIAGRLYDEVRG